MSNAPLPFAALVSQLQTKQLSTVVVLAMTSDGLMAAMHNRTDVTDVTDVLTHHPIGFDGSGGVEITLVILLWSRHWSVAALR